VKPTLYICIEIKSREYDSQILLAACSALRGYRVYVGSHAAIYALIRKNKKRDGIFLDKSTQPRERMLWIRERVQKYCILDAELSPILVEDIAREEFPTRIYEGTLDLVDKYFVVGPAMYKVAEEFFNSKSNVVKLSGWPRIDLWENLSGEIYRDEVNKIVSTYGEFHLFVSSFGQIRDPQLTENLKSADKVRSADLNSFERKLFQFNNFKKTVEMIREWDKLDNVPRIVLRPHPSEPISVWKDELKNLRKTFVIQEGDITPWILACTGMIHNGSTTAIQGYFAGKKITMIEEITTSIYAPVPKAISHNIIEAGVDLNQFDENESTKNLFFEPSILDEVIHRPINGATETLIDEFDDLQISRAPRFSRFQLLLSQVRPKSLIRSIGLIRDEIYWKFGAINITPQLHVIPGGLDEGRIRAVLNAEKEFGIIRYRRMSINLWEFDSKPSH
jgi:surface carbohydrate biosynthesis protein